MKLPRDVSGKQLATALRRLEYTIDHQTGSHIRATTTRLGEHHITIPRHDPLRVGTLSAILRDIERHHGLTREELLEKLFR